MEMAKQEFLCGRCKKFNKAEKRWEFGDVRVYRLDEQEAKALR
jgi:hypothetical protein